MVLEEDAIQSKEETDNSCLNLYPITRQKQQEIYSRSVKTEIETVEDIIKGRVQVDKNIFQSAKKSYNEMISNFSKLLQIQDIYSEPIEFNLISPNRFGHNFICPDLKRVRLIKTCTEEVINQRINECFKNGNHKIYLHGPDGIGKSYALLAHALKVKRDPRSICIYVHSPESWIYNEYCYIIPEIIYALIPFRQEIPGDPLLDSDILQGEDQLFKWLDACLELIFDRLKRAVLELGDVNMLWISDEENNWNDGDYTQFPYSLRLNFFPNVILSASTHHKPNKMLTTFKHEAVFTKLPDEQIKRLVLDAWRVSDIQEKDFRLLYEACRGNPLEAKNILLESRWDKTKEDFAEHLVNYFQERAGEVFQWSNYFQRQNSNVWGLDDFNEMLQYLDTEINIEKIAKREWIGRTMNKKSMRINEETKYLESLFPAAAFAFSLFKRDELLENKVKDILADPESYESEIIGRSFEQHIIHQFEQDMNQNKLFKLNYIDAKGKEGEFYFKYSRVILIPMGLLTPPKKADDSVMIIPRDPCYPCVSVFYYNFKEHILYAMKITVSFEKNKANHQVFIEKYFADWKEVLKKPEKDLKLRFIWIGGDWKSESYEKSITEDSWIISYNQLPDNLFNIWRPPPEIGRIAHFRNDRAQITRSETFGQNSNYKMDRVFKRR